MLAGRKPGDSAILLAFRRRLPVIDDVCLDFRAAVDVFQHFGMALPPERPVLLRRAGSCATVLALFVLSAVFTLSRCPCSFRFPPFTFIPLILALSREELYCPTYL